MSTYCEVQDVRDRVSDQGVLYVGDDDGDGSLESADDALIQAAIDAASSDIDMYLAGVFADPRTLVGNEWLSVCCVDLATARCVQRKRRELKVFADVAEKKRELLADVAARKLRIPGVIYPGDGTSIEKKRRFGLPMIAQPRG